MSFKKATKKQLKLKLAISGSSGSGKTYSALILAKGLSQTGKTALIDTEYKSASLYADRFNFDTLELNPPYTPENYIKAINEAERLGYETLIIDSITHEWNGSGGCLDLVNSLGNNSYVAWGKVTPRHNAFINRILNSKLHVICTMRSKTDYETGKDEKGKMTVEKKGTAPIQRDSVEYEFTIVFDLNKNHYASSSKDRTSLFDGKDFLITNETSDQLLDWLNSGEQEIITDDKLDKAGKDLDKAIGGQEVKELADKKTEIINRARQLYCKKILTEQTEDYMYFSTLKENHTLYDVDRYDRDKIKLDKLEGVK